MTTLKEDIRVALRVTGDFLDSEIDTLTEAARYDMERTGVDPNILALNPLTKNLDNAFVKQAVVNYCKAESGYDVSEASRFKDSYYRIVNDLLNSDANIAANGS